MASRLASCAVTSLTRRVGGLSLSNSCSSVKPLMAASFTSTSKLFVTPKMATSSLSVLPSLSLDNSPFKQTTRTMVTRKKRLARREKRRLAAKRETNQEGGKGKVVEQEEVAAPQHEEWVDFQKSISVSGFQTGQTTKARLQQKGESGQKLRDLKRREKMEMRLAAKRPDAADIRGGEYPTLRYSDEETERLLKMAYAAIPPRAGKRGTRNLKRQGRRWHLVRKIHKKHKRQVMAAHFRKMDERSVRIRETAGLKKEAVETRARDRSYQKEALQRWVDNLKKSDDDLTTQEIASGSKA